MVLAERRPDGRLAQVGAASRVGAPSGPIEPATSASRPATSRASRASCAPRRASAPAWSARPSGASRTRFAPNVAVSMRSAPASRYSRWIGADQLRAGRDQLVEATPAGGCRARTGACPSPRRRGAARPRAAPGTGRARASIAVAAVHRLAESATATRSPPRRRPRRSVPSGPSRTCGGRGRPL